MIEYIHKVTISAEWAEHIECDEDPVFAITAEGPDQSPRQYWLIDPDGSTLEDHFIRSHSFGFDDIPANDGVYEAFCRIGTDPIGRPLLMLFTTDQSAGNDYNDWKSCLVVTHYGHTNKQNGIFISQLAASYEHLKTSPNPNSISDELGAL